MLGEKKDIFEPEEVLKCPHCGETSHVNSKGKEGLACDYLNESVNEDNPVTWMGDFPWDWSERCRNCGKSFNVSVVLRVS